MAFADLVQQLLGASTVSRPALRECYRGHQMTPDNTYYYPGGKAVCMTCRRIASREFRRRAKAKENL